MTVDRKGIKPLRIEENGRKVWAVNDKGIPICGAKSKRRPGDVCQVVQIMDNGRCRMHGGQNMDNLIQPTFVHGRYSKYVPRTL